MQIIGMQLDLAWEDRAANYERAREMLDAAHIQSGAMIVFPEMFATGYSMNLATTVEPEDSGGPTMGFYIETARRHAAYVVGGIVRAEAGERARNEAVVIGPDGAEVARYCKMRPMRLAPAPAPGPAPGPGSAAGGGAEIDHYCRGEEVVTFRWGAFTVCPLICYDLRFPELFRRAVVPGVPGGADLFVVIASWPDRRQAHWTALLRARAIENQAYVVGVNRCGDDPYHHYAGGSVMFDPHGNPIADAGDAPTLLSATLRHEVVTQWREEFPALKDAE